MKIFISTSAGGVETKQRTIAQQIAKKYPTWKATFDNSEGAEFALLVRRPKTARGKSFPKSMGPEIEKILRSNGLTLSFSEDDSDTTYELLFVASGQEPAGLSALRRADLKKPASEVDFDSDDQEDAFFDVFDTIRGKQLKDGNKLVPSFVSTTPLYQINLSNGDGAYFCFKLDKEFYGLHFSAGGEETAVEPLKVKTTASLHSTVKKANKAADAADSESDELY